MTPIRPPSDANQELADWLAGQDYPTSPREIRTWRSNGWVASAIVRPMGYARPTETANPPEAFAQALAVAKVKNGKRMSPHLVVLGLYARGEPLAIELLHAAWADYFTGLRKFLDKLLPGNSDPSERGEALAAAVARVLSRGRSGRYMLTRAKKLGRSPTQILESAITPVFTGVLGGSVEPFAQRDAFGEASAVDELNVVTGMSGFVDDRNAEGTSIATSRDELQQDHVNLFEHLTLDNLEWVGQSADMESFASGRRQLLVMLTFIRNFVESNSMTSGPATSFGLSFVKTLGDGDESIAFMSLLMVVLDRWMPGRIEPQLPMWRVEGARHGALVVLLRMTPKHLRKYLGPKGVELLKHAPGEHRSELRDLIADFKSQYPELVAAVIQPAVELTAQDT